MAPPYATSPSNAQRGATCGDGLSIDDIIPIIGFREEDSMAGTGDNSPEETDAPDPRARLMHEVAEQMDAIEADFGDGYQIGRVITIVEITGPDGNVEL